MRRGGLERALCNLAACVERWKLGSIQQLCLLYAGGIGPGEYMHASLSPWSLVLFPFLVTLKFVLHVTSIFHEC